MPKIAPFEDIRSSLRDAICFWRFLTRAEARVYARLPLSRQGQTSQPSLIESVSHLDKWVGRERGEQPSALADYERSPAIDRRVSVENGIRRCVATVEPMANTYASLDEIQYP